MTVSFPNNTNINIGRPQVCVNGTLLSACGSVNQNVLCYVEVTAVVEISIHWVDCSYLAIGACLCSSHYSQYNSITQHMTISTVSYLQHRISEQLLPHWHTNQMSWWSYNRKCWTGYCMRDNWYRRNHSSLEESWSHSWSQIEHLSVQYYLMVQRYDRSVEHPHCWVHCYTVWTVCCWYRLVHNQ